MSLLAVDMGTTHWKAGLYEEAGRELCVRRIAAPLKQDAEGYFYYEPQDLQGSLRELTSGFTPGQRAQTQIIALTGMAEAGLVTHRRTGEPLTPILPWFDKRTVPLFEKLRGTALFQNRHGITGLPNSYKYGIYKLLYWKEKLSLSPHDLRWLGMVEYGAFLLTGQAAAEPTLAARTYAYNLNTRTWDYPLLDKLGLPASILPPLAVSGAAMGTLLPEAADLLGLMPGIPVCICGHDHLCAAYGAHALQPGRLFTSMGTAQVLLGLKNMAAPGAAETSTGLSFGPPPRGEGLAALGSIQSAGGSVTLWNKLLYGGQGYDALLKDVQDLPDGPSGLVYLPYLGGSGAPHICSRARGAFLDLAEDTTRPQMILGVYEGIAFESRLILQAAQMESAKEITACGGLSAHGRLMQTMADVLGMDVLVPALTEGTLYGAARLAWEQAGVLLPKPPILRRYAPRPALLKSYDALYHSRYLPLQEQILRHYDR